MALWKEKKVRWLPASPHLPSSSLRLSSLGNLELTRSLFLLPSCHCRRSPVRKQFISTQVDSSSTTSDGGNDVGSFHAMTFDSVWTFDIVDGCCGTGESGAGWTRATEGERDASKDQRKERGTSCRTEEVRGSDDPKQGAVREDSSCDEETAMRLGVREEE